MLSRARAGYFVATRLLPRYGKHTRLPLVRSVRDNRLGTEGWGTIFRALRDNKDNKIETWDLSKQNISPRIAKVLAEYLSVSTAVRSLKCAAPSKASAITVSSR